MKTSLLTTGETLLEYLLIVNPGGEVYNKIYKEKQAFYDQFLETGTFPARAWITVANFQARESMEETLLRWMRRICSNLQTFTVTLNNYSGFPPDTIYIRVQNESPFKKLAKELRVIDSYVSSCSCPAIKLAAKPHVNIAHSLSEEVYFRALIEYSHKSFHESFMVNELLLLRRKNKFDVCKTINVFGLPPARE